MQKKIHNIEEKTLVDVETGEVKKQEKTNVYKIQSEPAYIKLYIDDISKLYDLSGVTNNVLYELVKKMNYEGQICLNAGIKREIASRLGLKNIRSINNYLTTFCKKDILDWVDTGIYIANPNLFGRGSWADIYKLRTLWLKKTYTKNGEVIETPFTEKKSKKSVSGGN